MPSEAPYKLFGEVALELGFVRVAQLYEALTIQARAEVSGDAYRFLGEILVDLGHMRDHQVLEVLNVLHATESVSAV
jgi:rubrerythrin